MHFEGKNNSRQVFEGKLGVHPARRNGKLVPHRVRLIGTIPVGTWPDGFRGFIAPATGKIVGSCMLKLYAEDYLPTWLKNAQDDRSPEDVVAFQVQKTRAFSVYRPDDHPVVRAIQLATGKTLIGHSDVEFWKVLSTGSLSIRVPRPDQVRDYHFKQEKSSGQQELF